MRKLTLVSVVIASLALLFGAGAMPASADPGGNPNANANVNANGNKNNNGNNGNNGGNAGQQGNPPGANGTVKVHEYPQHKNGSENANDPKVCRFEIHGNNFDGGQSGRWWVQEHKWGNGDSTKAAAPVGIRSYTADGSGDWTDNNGGAGFTLAPGHYKLFVELTHRAGNSGNTVTTYKHKVFKVECPGATGSTGSTGSTGNQFRSETTIVVENGQQFRVFRLFDTKGVLVSEVRTPQGQAVAGFESGPTGQVEVAQPVVPARQAVAGAESVPAELAAIAALPATATSPNTGLGLIGLAMTTLGAALLRRHRRS